MKKEDLSEEQLAAFATVMTEAKADVKSILITSVLSLLALMAANVFILKYLEASQDCRFLIHFLTAVLIVGTTNNQLIKTADKFRQETVKILDNK